MSIEDLLRPRIKVIADFWDNPFGVGQILTMLMMKGGKYAGEWVYKWIDEKNNQGASLKRLSDFKQFPHLFKELEWHEERKSEEMPYAVNVQNTDYFSWENGVYKYAGWVRDGHAWWVKTDPNKFFPQWGTEMGELEARWFSLKNALPVTKEEYESYLKQKQ